MDNATLPCVCVDLLQGVHMVAVSSEGLTAPYNNKLEKFEAPTFHLHKSTMVCECKHFQ